jgi:hypothetical protein
MINADVRLYDYYTFGEPDEYGQPQLSKEPIAQLKMAVYVASQSIQDNVLYKNAEYIAFTFGDVKDNYVIDYNGQLLKVLYITPARKGFKQVMLARINNV